MPDLSVDVAVLDATESSITTLRQEFDGIETRTEDAADIYGHRGVADAMHEFSHNMRLHRTELSEKMSGTGEKVSATLETFREADQALADELERNVTTTTTLPGAC